MDAAGITRVSLFSQHPGPIRQLCPPPSAADFRTAIDHAASLQAADPDRIFGLFWADPRTDGILDLIDYALVDRELHGVKMIPNHWAACDDFMAPIYEKMCQLGKPLHFHSGILYAFGDSSRFCRPVLYETLINYPGLKFALAHIGWPWTDECLAVFGHSRSLAGTRGDSSGMWIDTCRGTPDAWREDALRKAVIFAGCTRLMYGTDTYPSGLATTAPVHIRKDTDLLRNEIGVSEQQLEDFFWNAAEQFYS
jgi:predicted TIM-barrel fold metal-dependent hydrolase